MNRKLTGLLPATFPPRWKVVVIGIALAAIFATCYLVIARAEDAQAGKISYITSFSDIGGVHWVRPAGLLMAGKYDPNLASRACTVVCRGWDGRKCWQVSIPATDWTGWGQKNWNRRAFAISPDGHVIGVAGAAGKSILCLIWKDGKEITRCLLPTGTKPLFDRQHRFKAVVTDDGCMNVWGQDNAETSIIAIQGKGVIARGMYRSHLVTKPGEGYNAGISPDGKTFVGYKYAPGDKLSYPDFEYATLQRDGDKITATFRYTANGIAPTKFCEGAVLNDWGGARLLATGQASRDDDWNVAPYGDSGGRTLTPKATLQAHGDEWRVMVPVTGTTWQGAQTTKPDSISVSYDGRFVVAVYDAEGIVVYEQPGTIIARLPFTEKTIHRTSHYEGNEIDDGDVTIRYLSFQGVDITNIDAAYISPNGSSLMVTGVRKDAPQLGEYHVFSLRGK